MAHTRTVSIVGAATGTWSGAAAALRPRGALGLLWIDAHMDAHRPHTSPSGNLHGMPLACLLGHGEPALATLAGAPALAPAHVCLVGVRSYEAEEAQLLEQLGVRVFLMDEVRRRGLPAVLREAHAVVTRGTAGFGVTLDVDAVDPQEAPGVGTPAPGGLRAGSLLAELERLGAMRASSRRRSPSTTRSTMRAAGRRAWSSRQRSGCWRRAPCRRRMCRRCAWPEAAQAAALSSRTSRCGNGITMPRARNASRIARLSSPAAGT
jgi:hypothetical protein